MVMLLYKSGTLSRFRSEVQSGAPFKVDLRSKGSTTPQLADQPELYDHLIEATKKLQKVIDFPSRKGKLVELRQYDANLDLKDLYDASNGNACFHESSYDPQRIWGWIPNFPDSLPCRDKETLSMCLQSVSDKNGSHLVILDPVLKKTVGMLSLINNSPENLTIQIENLWLTPSYQGTKFAHDAIFLLLDQLVFMGYRRIVAEVDTRHLIARKFFERCDFKIEGILRKHRIVNNRNRDTALYVLLNSDWPQVSMKMKKYLGIDLKPKAKKLAEIDRPDDLFKKSNLKGESKSKKDTKKKKKKSKK